MPHRETKTQRALGMYGAGVPIEEIEEETGVPRATIYSEACRRRIVRPATLLDAAAIEFTPTEEAIEEAWAYWRRVSLRHQRYWERERRRIRSRRNGHDPSHETELEP